MTREEKEQWDIFMKIWVIPALKNTWDEKKCKEIVEALEEWEEQESWIPVSEKLPEIHNCSDNYLVTLKRGGVHIAMFTECDGKHWWTYDDVEAWMPLPKPYKTESER